MRTAYDTFLEIEVTADLAAKNGGSEVYRYECALCGEEVLLAAVGSVHRVPHFRHRSGNNDVKCEKYHDQRGMTGTNSHSHKTKKQADFYFDSSTKMFYLGMYFSDEEIATCEEVSAKLELRVAVRAQPFYALPINRKYFASEESTLIPITRFSNTYYLSSTLDDVKSSYMLFNKDGTPAFFKILGNDSEYRAKLIRSTILYTGIPYFVVTESHVHLLDSNYSTNEIEITSFFSFSTIGRNFIGQTLIIKNKTTKVESLFSMWGYQVEASETLTLLWPPAVELNETSVVNSEKVFLFSSFDLEPYGNTNVRPEDLIKYQNGISCVSIHSKVKVRRKNVEITIGSQKPHPVSYSVIILKETYEHIFQVPDDGTYYLFDRSGVSPVKEGMTVQLTPNRSVNRYNSGYLDGIVYSLRQEEMSAEKLLNDLLAHYKRTESLSLEPFVNLKLSKTASKYIEECIENGSVINSAAKRFIEEGRL